MSDHGPRQLAAVDRLDVAIRADASTHIGAGHVMRCLTLAQALRADGHTVTFIIRDADGDLSGLVSDRYNFPVAHLPQSQQPANAPTPEATDADETLAALEGRDVDWVIVDHYALGATWESRLASTGLRVLAIDDFASRDHACDVLVDHNLSSASEYEKGTHAGTELLLGPRFALLRPEFAPVADSTPVPDQPTTVAVSFGGHDATGQTLKVLHALRHSTVSPSRVIVIAGRNHPELLELQRVAADWSAVDLLEFVDDLAPLMAEADLAIGGGGVSALERVAIGVPSICLATAANQERPAATLAEAGALLYLGRASETGVEALTAAINVMCNPYLRQAMRRRGLALTDGRGPSRVVRAMRQRAAVAIRRATASDRSRVYSWRNHPTVRATAIDPTEISCTTHNTWFAGILEDPDRHLLIAEHNGTPIGVVRFDIVRASQSAEVSIFLDPSQLGSGLGTAVLTTANAWLFDQEIGVERIDAKILETNPRSRRTFEAAGFTVHQTLFTLARGQSTHRSGGAVTYGGRSCVP